MTNIAAGYSELTKRPPLVKGYPVIGSLKPLLENPHEFVKSAYKEYGNAFRFKAAHREYTVLAGVEANRFISGEGKDCFGVDGFWGKAGEYMGCPHLMIAVDGDIHRYQRNIMMPLLSQNAFKDRLDDLAAPIQSLLPQFSRRRSVHVGPMVRQMISNQISLSLQGHATSHKKVEQMIYYFGGVMNVFGLRKWPRFMLELPKFKLARHITLRHVKRVLKFSEQRTEAEKMLAPHYLDTILPAMKAKPEWFSRGDLEGQALLPYVAALDTVAATMGFMLHRLLCDAVLKARVQAEVDSVFAQGIPDIKTLRGMAALNGLIKETMRLQPTGFGITRSATRDFEFQGFRILKGEDILVFTTADHSNPAFFSEPDLFDVDRFAAPRNEHRQPAYAPFGKGPHNCLGASMAEIMLPLDMGLLLYHLEVRAACDLKSIKIQFNPAPVLSNNFKVKLKLRNTDLNQSSSVR